MHPGTLIPQSLGHCLRLTGTRAAPRLALFPPAGSDRAEIGPLCSLAYLRPRIFAMHRIFPPHLHRF